MRLFATSYARCHDADWRRRSNAPSCEFALR
jgi:hypothetical protein